MANVNDLSELVPRLNSLPEVAGKFGQPRRSPMPCRGTWPTTPSHTAKDCATRGGEPILLAQGIDDQSGLGETRWPVERTVSWTRRNRWLRYRYERRVEIHHAFPTLA